MYCIFHEVSNSTVLCDNRIFVIIKFKYYTYIVIIKFSLSCYRDNNYTVSTLVKSHFCEDTAISTEFFSL